MKKFTTPLFRSHLTTDGFLSRLRTISYELPQRITRHDHRETSMNLTTTDSHAATVIEHEACRAGLFFTSEVIGTLDGVDIIAFGLKNFAR
jgi:hypothetical protein